MFISVVSYVFNPVLCVTLDGEILARWVFAVDVTREGGIMGVTEKRCGDFDILNSCDCSYVCNWRHFKIPTSKLTPLCAH